MRNAECGTWHASASPHAPAFIPHSATRDPHLGGFTLIELLVSMVILGTLVGGLGLALSTGLDADQRARREGDRAQEVRIVVEALRADIQQAALTPVSQRSWLIGTDENDGERDADTLRLTTRSRRVPLRRFELLTTGWESQSHDADWSAVTYSLAPAGTGEKLGFFRRELIPPGVDPLEETGVDERLSEAVTGFNVRYFDGEEWADSWDTTQDTTVILPRVVEVTFDLHGGDRQEGGFSVTAAFPIRAVSTAGSEATGEGANAGAPAGP